MISNRKTGLVGISNDLLRLDFDKDKYVSREFQKYGYDLAQELGDKNVSLYIKLAKDTPREHIEAARNFVKDANNVRSKPALFLWKLKALKRLKVDKDKEKEKTK